MKEFVVEDLAKFLEISDTFDTPMKFLEVNESTVNSQVVYELKATVWLRSAYLAYEDVCDKEHYEQKQKKLDRHGFALATIREAPITLR